MKNQLVLLTIFLTTTACSSDRTERSIPEGAKAGDIILKQCTFKTKSKTYRAECGALIVRESTGSGSSRLISLPVIRIHAVNSNPSEPIFYLAGGPGQTNIKFKPPDELLADHDFVMTGYRGVDGSVRLDCPEVNKAIKGKGKDLLNKPSLENLDKAYCECAARLQSEGIDLNAYTMPDVIRDMETAREALGYNRINLLSQSYGTRIAQIYAYQHPDIIFRSVMVGVNPPGRFVWEPKTIDQQIEYYNRLWSGDSLNALRSIDLIKTIRSVLQTIPDHWLFFPIDPGKVKVITFALLYHRNTAAQVFDTYIAAEKGDPSGLALMTLAYDLMFPKMITWGDLASKATSADYDSTRNYAIEMDPPGSILGSPFSRLLWSLADWPTAKIPDDLRKVQRSSTPTLLISGSVDFATPAEYATDQLLPYLENGKQVILAEMGHTHDLWNVQRAATIRLITSFVNSGLADDSLFKYAPADFHVKGGFPLIAKISLAFTILLLLGIAFLFWAIVRRICGNKPAKIV
jgi:pimeloyl-ACP methyl ester carboxylesterase